MAAPLYALPASDISGITCERGEVSASAFERYRIETYREAGFKPYVIAAMMLTNRFGNPGEVLSTIIQRNPQAHRSNRQTTLTDSGFCATLEACAVR